jgi:hypothetical protein
MNLNEFISHIKHRSLKICVSYGGGIAYLGTVGEFESANVRSKIGKCKINTIEPISGSLNIFLEEE